MRTYPPFAEQRVLRLTARGLCGCVTVLWRLHSWTRQADWPDVVECGHCNAAWLAEEGNDAHSSSAIFGHGLGSATG